MLIEKYIKLSQQMENQKHGGNKKCFLFDEYALLVNSGFIDLKITNSIKEKFKKEIQIINKLKNDGIAVVPPLEYKIDTTTASNKKYSSIYCLQERAKGNELYNSSMPVNEYEKRLKEVSQMPPKNFNKFISDWIAINNAGISVDPSKCGNFFFFDGQISFIDLNLNKDFFIDEYKEKRMKTLFMESFTVLTGAALKFKYDTERKKETKYYDYIRIIFNKLFETVMQKKLPIDNNFFERCVRECYTDNTVIEELLEKNKKYNQTLQFNDGTKKILNAGKIATSNIAVKSFEK